MAMQRVGKADRPSCGSTGYSADGSSAEGVTLLKRGSIAQRATTGICRCPYVMVQNWTDRRVYQGILLAAAIVLAPIHMDHGLRPMSDLERQTLDEYLVPLLSIDQLLAFVNATLPRLAQMHLLHHHEERLKGTLLAKMPAAIHLGTRMAYLYLMPPAG